MRVPESQTHMYGIAAGPKIGEREYRIDSLVEKPKKDAPSNLAVIGRYVLPSKIFLMLRTIKPGVGGEIQLTDALAMLAAEEGLLGYRFEGLRYDAGDRLGYLKANIAFALKRPDMAGPLRRWLGDVL